MNGSGLPAGARTPFRNSSRVKLYSSWFPTVKCQFLHAQFLSTDITSPSWSSASRFGRNSSFAKSNAHWWSMMSPLCSAKSRSCSLKYVTASFATTREFL